MKAWTCMNCGVVFTEKGYITVTGTDIAGEDETEGKDYFIKEGACPGCGGKGCIVEPVE